VMLCLSLAGCSKQPAEQTAKPTGSATQVVVAGDGAAAKPVAPPAPVKPAVPAVDCAAQLEAVMTHIRDAYIAKNAMTPRKEAAKLWPTMPDACRNGLWFLEAALLLNAGELELSTGTIKLASEEAALTFALQQPDHVDVLERVALVSALGRKPVLPDDACKRAQAVAGSDTEGAAYVCARAAIAAGDGKTAKEQLAAIKSTTGRPDVELARAQAAKLNADAKTRQAQAKLAMKLDINRASLALIKERDRKAIVDLAKPLAK
jgi:hypothetical protein